MKNLYNWFLALSVLLLASVLYYKFVYNKQDFSNVEIKQQLIDIGERKPDEPISLTFEIKNISDTDFLINKVDADCHCTVPDWTKEPVTKDEAAKIFVTYDNSNMGYFQQSITVHCNAENSPLILTLQGKTVE